MSKTGEHPEFFTDIVGYRRIMPSLSPPPLSTFQGFLKRIDNLSLSDSQQTALSLAAPHFSDHFVFKYELDVLRDFIYCGKKRSLDKMTHLNKYSARRYAGGDDLSRGRYYTLAKDADGDDGGTLRCELFAYQSVYWAGMTLIEDSECLDKFVPEENLKQLLRQFPHSILIYFFNAEDAPHRFFYQIDSQPIEVDFVQTDSSGAVRGLVFALPYEVKHYHIEKVLDLREPEAQDWLVGLARDRKLELSFMGKDLPSFKNFSFFDLLRHLVSPINGGGMVTDIIGAYLRHLGVSGLVYPSARYDSSIQYNYGQVIDFDGWNFLDLRSAEMNSELVEFDHEIYELSMLDYLYTTDFETSGMKSGGWSRKGVTIQYSRIQAEDFARIKSENDEQREFRMRDYWLYWKTVRILGDSEFHSYLSDCMAQCGLHGTPEDISPRMWQYVLSEVSLDLEIPNLVDSRNPVIPLDLRLIGNW